MTYNSTRQTGFTLIELLMVVGVIGVLAGLTTMVLKPGEMAARGRDSKRQADLEAVASALALYKVDQTDKRYPADTGSPGTDYASVVSTLAGGDYLDQTINDPTSGWSYRYCVNDATRYGFRLEADYESAERSGQEMNVSNGASPPGNC